MKKRFLCFVTLLCMMVNIISPLGVRAIGIYDCVKVGKIEYMCMGSYMQVLYADEDISGEVVIPSYVSGLPVTKIGESAFYCCPGITSVIIPEGITYIDMGAFTNSYNIQSIVIPASLQYIDGDAISGHEALRDVYFGGSEARWREIAPYMFLYTPHVTMHYNSTGPTPSINVHKTDIDAMGKSVEKELNSLLKSVTLCDTTIKGPSFEINGNVITPLEFDAKAVLDLSGLSKCITIDTDKKTVHVILGKLNEDGKASVVQTTKTCDASWGKQYSEIKDLYKKMIGGDMSSRKNWNNFEKLKGELNSIKCDMFIEAEMQCVAYLDFDYQTGSLRLSEGGFIESASLGVNFNYPLIGKCLYATLGLKGSEEGTIKAVVTSSGEINPQMSIKPSLTAKGSITGEIPMLCNAEGGIDATLAVLLQTFDPKLTVTMGGKIFLEAKVFNKSLIDWSHPYADVELYPEFKANSETASLTSLGTTEEIYANAKAVPRDYLRGAEAFTLNEASSDLVMKGVYPDNNAELVSIDDNTQMLIWTGDDGTKSDINRTSLMYSICSDGVWSEAREINADGCAVGDFEAIKFRDTVYIVYQKLSKPFEDSTTVEEILASSDLYVTSYNGTDFEVPECINESGNRAYEHISEIAANGEYLYVYWIENSNNDVFLASGETVIKINSLLDYGWSGATIVESNYGNEGVYPGEVHVSGSTHIYTRVNSTGEKTYTELVPYSSGIFDNHSFDFAIYNLEIVGDKLYYIRNSEICSFDGNEETALGISGVFDFKTVTNGNSCAALINTGDELYISYIENGVWSTPERFTDMGRYIRSYSPLMDENGTVKAAVSSAAVNEKIEAFGDVYGETSITIAEQCNYLDLSSTYVYYDEETALLGSDVELCFNVYNDCAKPLEELNVSLADGDGNVLLEKSIACDIAPFTESVESVVYSLPEKLAKTELNLSVSVPGEKSYENNTVSTEIGYANLSVAQTESVVNADKTADIKAVLTNTGFETAESVIVTVHNGTADGEILKTIEAGSIAPGESVDIEYQFAAELMTEDENAMDAVYISVQTVSEESRYSDNTQKAVFSASDAPEPTPTAAPVAQINFTYGENTYTRQMEKLDRGLVAIKMSNGVYVGWRMSGEEGSVADVKNAPDFEVYRNGEKIAVVEDSTNYFDKSGKETDTYSVAIAGGEQCEALSPLDNNYFDIPMDIPEDFVDGETSYPYTVGEASCGDLDGDGQYEIVVKWDANAQDNSHSGVTGNVYLDAYKLTGEKLWRIDLGRNIRAGAHYTQFLVYDFDLDGYAEVTAKTAPGSIDGKGKYVSEASLVEDIRNVDNSAVFINDGGYILEGDEFFTVFDGRDGKALDTIYYPNQRISVEVWGDDYGNRCDRYLADVAYLDGERPYAVYWRGYYGPRGRYGTRTGIFGARLDENKRLQCDYCFDTYDTSTVEDYKGVYGYSENIYQYTGQGNHNMTVADVDNDGKDEFISGALCLEVNDEDKLAVKWCSYRGHGDALHIGDYDPTHPGFEYFSVHEGGGYTDQYSGKEIDYGMTVYDAATGEELFHKGAADDTGRGVMANIGSGGYYQIAGVGNVVAMGNGVFEESTVGPGNNFRVFWDADLYDEMSNSTYITDWNGEEIVRIFTAAGCTTGSSTKYNPAIQADLFGDWREEMCFPLGDYSAIRVFTTTDVTGYKLPTLMHDPVYRSGVAAQQTAYNQPPHVGFYMDNEMFIRTLTAFTLTPPDKTVYKVGEQLDLTGMKAVLSYDDGTNEETNSYEMTEFNPMKAGEQEIIVTYKEFTEKFTVTVESGFTCDENGYITGYNGTEETEIIPEYIGDAAIVGIAEGALENTSIRDLYVYNHITDIKANDFGETVIHCYRNGAAYKYAFENNAKYELIEVDVEEYVIDIDFEEDDFVNLRMLQGREAISASIEGLTFGMGARPSGGDSRTGFYTAVEADGNTYMNCGIGRFGTSNRHAYLAIDNALPLEDDTDVILSFDIMFPEQLNMNGEQVMAYMSIEDENGIIDTCSKDNLGMEIRQWYNYSLVYSGGEYVRTITDAEGKVISVTKLGATESLNAVSKVQIYLDNTYAGVDYMTGAYAAIDNFKYYTVEKVVPTATPTVEPTATPTPVPTATPTAEPTATPTVEPTATPTPVPTPAPSFSYRLKAFAAEHDKVYAEVESGELAFEYNCACIIAQFDADGRLVAVDFAHLDDVMYLEMPRHERAVTAEVYIWTDEMKSLEIKEIDL